MIAVQPLSVKVNGYFYSPCCMILSVTCGIFSNAQQNYLLRIMFSVRGRTVFYFGLTIVALIKQLLPRNSIKEVFMKRLLLYVSLALVLGLTVAAVGAANKDTESTDTKACKVSVEPSNKAVCAMAAPQTRKGATCPMAAARAGSANLSGSCDMGKSEASLKCENKCPRADACLEKGTCENKAACPNKDDCPKKVDKKVE